MNVPVSVGNVVVNPGDMVFGDDDGVLVASPPVSTWPLCRRKKPGAR